MAYLARRFVQSLAVLLFVMLIIFTILRLQGDPIFRLVPPRASPDVIADVRRHHALDEPLPIQFAVFVGKVVQGEWGKSLRYRYPAWQLLLDYGQTTVTLASATLALTVLLGGLLGIAAGARPRSFAASFLPATATFSRSVPDFWIGVVLMLVVGVSMRWLPVAGHGGVQHYYLPMSALAISLAPRFARIVQAAMRQTLAAGFAVGGPALGARGLLAFAKRIVRASLRLVFRRANVAVPLFLGSIALMEQVYVLPGAGRLTIQAAMQGDRSLVQAGMFLFGLATVTVRFALDALYAAVDPAARRVVKRAPARAEMDDVIDFRRIRPTPRTAPAGIAAGFAPARPRPRQRAAVVGWIAAILLGSLVFSAVFADLMSPFDPSRQELDSQLIPPAWTERGRLEFFLGTDSLGRDVLSRLIHGSRASLRVGLMATLSAAVTGFALGSLAAVSRAPVAASVHRLADAFSSVPYILLVIGTVGMVGHNLGILWLVLGVTAWPPFARLAHAYIAAARGKEAYLSARASGARGPYLVARHVIPHLVGPLAALFVATWGTLLLTESSLTFLNLGINPPEITWGGLLASGREYIGTAWWMILFPGIAISIAMLGIVSAADWLRARTGRPGM